MANPHRNRKHKGDFLLETLMHSPIDNLKGRKSLINVCKYLHAKINVFITYSNPIYQIRRDYLIIPDNYEL